MNDETTKEMIEAIDKVLLLGSTRSIFTSEEVMNLCLDLRELLGRAETLEAV